MKTGIATRVAAVLTVALAATTVHADSFEELLSVGTAGSLHEAAGVFVPVFDDSGNRTAERVFLLHGGYPPELDAQPLADVWALADGYWQHMTSDAPFMASHRLVAAFDGRAWAVGAIGADGWTRPMNTLYAFEVRRTHGRLEVAVESVDVPGPAPDACFGATAVAVDGGRSILVVGGDCLGNPLQPDPSGLWEYRIDTNRWSRMADLPVSISGHSAVVARDFVWVFGGTTSHGLSNQIYRYDLLGDDWSQVEIAGDRPAPRRAHRAVAIGSNMLVLGGIEDRSVPTTMADVWQLDLDRLRWTEKAPLPTGLAGMAAAVAPTRLEPSGTQSVLAYGGVLDAWSFPPELSDRTLIYTSDVPSVHQRLAPPGELVCDR